MTNYLHLIDGKLLTLTAESTFETIARDWHKNNLRRWSEDHAQRIMRRMEVNLFPRLREHPIGCITTYQLMQAIRPVEARGAVDLASRLVQYTVSIFCHAACHCSDYGQRENPAWALRSGIAPPDLQHRPALPLEQFGEFFRRLDGAELLQMEHLAMLIQLHTFVRSSELRFARWKEIDLAHRIWEIPGQRTPLPGVKYSDRGSKMGTPHLVPLSRQVIAFLEALQALRPERKPEDLVIHAVTRQQKPMTDNRINHLLRKMGYNTRLEVCGHGFRTMACSTLVESSHWSRDAIERQMSHQERNNVRAAYIHKAEHIHERRRMMQWWSDYLDASRKGYIPPYEFAGLEDSVYTRGVSKLADTLLTREPKKASKSL